MNAACLDQVLQYPYGLTKDSTNEEEAEFIGYPVGNSTPTGCSDGFTTNVSSSPALLLLSPSTSAVLRWVDVRQVLQHLHDHSPLKEHAPLL